MIILQHPDPRLRKVAKEVTEFDDSLKQTVDNLYETMYHVNGGAIGLAATQVGINQRIAVIDIDTPLTLINPKVLRKKGITTQREGCLSLRGTFRATRRAKEITISYQGLDGAQHQLTAKGLLSVCIQHEIDHLNGVLILTRGLKR